MNRFLKILSICLIGVSQFACANIQNVDLVESKPPVEEEKVVVDMSDYKGMEQDDHMFVYCNSEDYLEMIENEETFVVYFGQDQCGYCNKVIQILNDVAKEYETSVYYINTRENGETLNSDIPHYEEVLATVSDLISENEDGEKYLYTPSVIFVVNGVAKKFVGAVASNDDTGIDNEAQKKYYEEGFDLITKE